MIISRTPLRIEFTGGSDLPAFYHHEPGAIVNATIDKYIYVLVRHPSLPSSHNFHLTHEIIERTKDLNQIKHDLIKATLKFKKLKALHMSSISDLPPQTGLGSSGSFLVGLLNTLYHIEGKKMSPKELAHEAFHIESKLAKVSCGPQDHMAASHGGLRLHEFFPDDSVKSTLIKCSSATRKKLERNLLLFYTGNQRSSNNLLDNLWTTLDKNPQARKLMAKRVQLSHLMAKKINENSLQSFGDMLDEEWRLKKAIAPIETNSYIDGIYEKAKKSGAEGGKLIGAGGAGFMLFYAPEENHERIIKNLQPLQETDFSFTDDGSKIISTI